MAEQTINDELAAIIMEHFKEGSHPGSSWRLNPTAAADAIIERYRLVDKRDEATAVDDVLGIVTRVTVVHPVDGRDYERRDFEGVSLSVQDNGRTLKVLPKPAPCPYNFAHTRHWCGNDTCRES